jgi:16S rRNA processing protein RimM
VPPDARFVVLGAVTGAYGVKGWVRIQPCADDPLAWGAMSRWWLAQPGRTDEDATWRAVDLRACRAQGKAIVATLAEVNDRDAASGLTGLLVGAPRHAAPKTGDNEYYWSDLIGLAVVNRAGIGLGAVETLLDTGAGCVLVVRDGTGAERLIPFVGAVIDEVNVDRRRIGVDWGADW